MKNCMAFSLGQRKSTPQEWFFHPTYTVRQHLYFHSLTTPPLLVYLSLSDSFSKAKILPRCGTQRAHTYLHSRFTFPAVDRQQEYLANRISSLCGRAARRLLEVQLQLLNKRLYYLYPPRPSSLSHSGEPNPSTEMCYIFLRFSEVHSNTWTQTEQDNVDEDGRPSTQVSQVVNRAQLRTPGGKAHIVFCLNYNPTSFILENTHRHGDRLGAVLGFRSGLTTWKGQCFTLFLAPRRQMMTVGWCPASWPFFVIAWTEHTGTIEYLPLNTYCQPGTGAEVKVLSLPVCVRVPTAEAQ